MKPFERFLSRLATIPGRLLVGGKLYKLPHVLRFSILAVVTGANAYRGIQTFIAVHRRSLNEASRSIGGKRRRALLFVQPPDRRRASRRSRWPQYPALNELL
jgi:hypothetical protein